MISLKARLDHLLWAVHDHGKSELIMGGAAALIASVSSALISIACRILRARPSILFFADLGGSVRAEPAHVKHLLDVIGLDEQLIPELHWTTLRVANYGRIDIKNLTFQVTFECPDSRIVAVTSHGAHTLISLNHGRDAACVRVSLPFFVTSERFSLVIYYRGPFSAPRVHCGISGIMGGVEHAPRGFLGLPVTNSGECRVVVN